MKKTKFLSLLALLPAVPTLAIATSCTTGSVSTSQCVITVIAGTGGKVNGASTMSVEAGTTWGDVKSNWSVTPNSNYNFKGWYNGSTAMTDSTVINSNITVTAKFESTTSQCVITFKAATGGKISGTTSLSITPGTMWKDILGKPSAVPNNNYDFDDWYNGSTKVTDSLVISSSITITAKFTAITATKEVEASINCLTTSTSGYYEYVNLTDYEGFGSGYSIRHFNDSPMGYISLNKYIQDLYEYFYEEEYYTVTTSNRKTTITNNMQSGDNTCVIDHDKHTITFKDYENFMSYGMDPMTGGANGGQNYFYDISVNQYNKNKSYVIDLTKYNMRTYCYTYYDDEAKKTVTNGFVPYEVYTNVFQESIGITSWNLDYNGDGFYEIATGTEVYEETEEQEAYPLLDWKSKAKSKATIYTKPYMEYLYDMLALTLDMHFGMSERTSRKDGSKVYYLTDGAYAALEPYHDKLVSMDNDVSSEALQTFFNTCLDDGGHSGYANLNAFSTKEIPITKVSDLEKICGEESYYNLSTIYYPMYWGRSGAGISTGYETYGSGDDKIAYVTFDTFQYVDTRTSAIAKWDQTERDAGRELQSKTTDSNYMNDTIRMTMYANKQLQEAKAAGSPIKNLVIDLSCNGGGTVYTEFFLASWLCNGVRQKICNPKTGSYCDFTVKADIDGDGKFDENDYIGDDVNLYIITSTSSFSCGNMLPCNIQDNRPNKTVFMGTKSGGGACYVNSGMLYGLNTEYQTSSLCHMLRLASTASKFVSVDDGCSITSGWEMSDVNEQDKFYDRDAINAKIWGK